MVLHIHIGHNLLRHPVIDLLDLSGFKQTLPALFIVFKLKVKLQDPKYISQLHPFPHSAAEILLPASRNPETAFGTMYDSVNFSFFKCSKRDYLSINKISRLIHKTLKITRGGYI